MLTQIEEARMSLFINQFIDGTFDTTKDNTEMILKMVEDTKREANDAKHKSNVMLGKMFLAAIAPSGVVKAPEQNEIALMVLAYATLMDKAHKLLDFAELAYKEHVEQQKVR